MADVRNHQRRSADDPERDGPGHDRPDDLLGDVLRLVDRLPFVGSLRRDVQNLKHLVYERRAPRIAALGRTGSGRSSLLNALLGKDALPLEGHPYVGPGRWVRVSAAGSRVSWLEVPLDPEARAEDALRRSVDEMVPDCVLIVARPATVEEGLDGIPERAAEIVESFREDGSRPPVLAVLAQVDRIAPEEVAAPFPDAKRTAIDLERQRLERLLRKGGLEPKAVIAIGGLSTSGAGAYGTGRLAEAIIDAVPASAQLEGARAFVDAGIARRRLATDIVNSCAALSATVAVTPIPLSDIWVLGSLQVAMVGTVAHLSGRAWDRKAVSEWLGSMGVVGGAGLGLRWSAQQLCKLLPGAGSLISAGVAGGGTLALGRSAMSYFLGEKL